MKVVTLLYKGIIHFYSHWFILVYFGFRFGFRFGFGSLPLRQPGKMVA